MAELSTAEIEDIRRVAETRFASCPPAVVERIIDTLDARQARVRELEQLGAGGLALCYSHAREGEYQAGKPCIVCRAEVAVEAARSSANFLLKQARQFPHKPAVAECLRCNLLFLADWALKVLGEEPVNDVPPGPPNPPRKTQPVVLIAALREALKQHLVNEKSTTRREV